MTEIQVLVTVDFPEPLIDRLKAVSPQLAIAVEPVSDAEQLSEQQLADVEVLYTRKALPDPERVPNLRWVQFHWAGIDEFVDHSLLRSEVKITTLSGAAVTQMAEFALTMLLAIGHRVPQMLKDQEQKHWAEDRFTRFRPKELRGSTVGIAGYGSIGREIARLCKALGAEVLASKRDLKQLEQSGYMPEGRGDPEAEIPARIYPPQALGSMASESDYLVLAVPLTPNTRGLVDAEVLKKMKQSAYLVDLSRGGVLDHGALIEALREGRIAGAALDVFPVEPIPANSPLWELPNVILSPHVAGTSGQYLERAAELFAENLRRYVTNEPLLNLFDPEHGY